MIISLKPFLVDNQMTIVSNLNSFFRQPYQALDVKQILFKWLDVFCFKNDYISSVWFAKIIGEPVDQQMVTRLTTHIDNVISFFVCIVVLRV